MSMRAGLWLLGALVGIGQVALVACAGGSGSNNTAGSTSGIGASAGSSSSTGAAGGHGGAPAGSGGSGGQGVSSTSASSTSTSSTSASSTSASAGSGGASGAGGSPIDAGAPDACPTGTGCYVNACTSNLHTLQENRDRLIADLATRKCTTSCGLWAALNEAERYIFLMDTAYFGASSSLLFPPGYGIPDTALDHATALYSINGPLAGQGVDGSGRGGNDYNRIYLGFDALGKCVMRNFAAANPTMEAGYNQWVTSDDPAGPHAPFTQREMIFWYRAIYDLSSNGPQFHHWAKDSDFTQSGINVRLGVCGVTDTSLTESTIAFDFYHNSDPLGDYSGMGGYGWQIVDMYVGLVPDWTYMPTGCPVTAPVNTDEFGGGTFAGMGPTQVNGACVATPLGTCP
jgi:hypothetical protein